MPPLKITPLNVCIDESLLLSALGALLITALEPHAVESIEHPIDHTITWEGWVVAIVDESIGLCAFADELKEEFPDRCIMLVLQDLGSIDQQLVQLQMSKK